MLEFDLMLLVVNMGYGSPALRLAKRNGVRGGTILRARGTMNSRILEFLELNDIRREVLIMAAERSVADNVVEILSKELGLKKPGHGIAACIPMRAIVGTRGPKDQVKSEGHTMTNPNHQAIFTVVDKGMAEGVVNAAKAAGARGGTIINARGSGIHETEVLFAMPIEPERELVMIIVQADIAERVIESIREQIHLDEAGKGVMFVLDVRSATGLY